jgi:tetratricopeptide (TPR) repeat protein
LNALHSAVVVYFEDTVLFLTRVSFFVLGVIVLLLQACASGSPAIDSPQVSSSNEITLNLPDQTLAPCVDDQNVGIDYTYLEKGFSAMVAGDNVEAVNYFRRYQRLESSPGADWEAGIAIAYEKMLPDSPYYNWRAAADAYRRLMRRVPEGIELNQQVLILGGTLAVLVELHDYIDELQNEKDDLSENLEKREEALKRLRELILGQ